MTSISAMWTSGMAQTRWRRRPCRISRRKRVSPFSATRCAVRCAWSSSCRWTPSWTSGANSRALSKPFSRLTIHLPSGITPSFAGGRAVQRNGSRIRRRLKCLFLVRLFSFSRRMTMDLLGDNVRAIYRKYFLAAFGSALISCIYGVVDMAMVGQYQGPDGTAALPSC